METYFHKEESGAPEVVGEGTYLYEHYNYSGDLLLSENRPFKTRLIPKIEPQKSEERRLRPPTIIKPYRGQTGSMTGDLIRMSNYGAGVGETRYFPVPYARTVSQTGDVSLACSKISYQTRWNSYKYDCGPAVYAKAIQNSSTTLYTDSDHLATDLGFVPEFGVYAPDPSSAIEHVKGSVVDKLSNTYDLLTEIAEFSETTHMVMEMINGLRRPMDKMRQIHREYSRLSIAGASRKTLNSLSSAWMQYRYGIMPTVYSIQDLLELYTQEGAFRTVRAKESLSGSFKEPPFDIELPYLKSSGEVKVDINGTGKAYYNSVALRTASQIRVNVPATLWEITKFSWMVDWFANVGDFLNAKVYQYTSIATEENCCYSLKVKIQKSTELIIPERSHTFSINPTIVTSYGANCPGWAEENIRKNILELTGTTNGGGLFSTQSEEVYSRVVFDKGDVSLSLNPDLNWKRGLDALSLTIMKTNNRLRKMK